MTEITKRIDFHTFPGCDPCVLAMYDLERIVKENNVPLNVIKHTLDTLDSPDLDDLVFPLTCVVNDDDGKDKTICVKGWNSFYADDIKQLIH